MWQKLQNNIQKFLPAVLGLGAALFITVLSLAGLFEFLEVKAIDAGFNLRGPLPPTYGAKNNPASPNPETAITIVAIDDQSFTQNKLQWPWPRSYMAQLINKIAEGKPKAITVDIFWFEPSTEPGGDEALAKAIATAGNVILANDISHEEVSGFSLDQYRTPIPVLQKAAKSLGLANLKRDDDGFVREMPIFIIHKTDNQAYFSWSAMTAFSYLNLTPPAQIGSPLQLGNLSIPHNVGYVNVNYRGEPGKVFDTIPAYQVVNGDLESARGKQFFKYKIVLIGATSISLQDSYPSPFGGANPPMPGVEIHANLIETILSKSFLNRWPPILGALVTLILGILAYFYSTLTTRAWWLGPLLSIGTLIGYLVFWYVSFTSLQTEIYVAAPVISLIISNALPTTYRATSEALEKRRVRNLFAQFVSPDVVGQIIEQGIEASRGKRTELTTMFSDIRGFTTMSEKMTPDEVVDMLNEYLGIMSEVILKHGGTIDKYEGDLIMAFFNAPIPQEDHAKRAVAAAIDMRLTLDQLKARWKRENSRPTNFEMGIGLNTGEAFVGLIGTKRINYTCIGDSVNLASRVQDLTKDLKWPLLITEFTYELVKDEFDCEFAEARLVKGKTKPVGMYRVLGRKGAPENERVRALFA